MVPEALKQVITLDDGRTITIETGKLAKQADGSVVVRSGDTMLLATVVSSKEAREGVDFLPLTVEYKEKFPAAGRYPGGFNKREGRPTDEEILVARLVDRILRPIFPADYHSETQVIIQLISLDPNVRPDSMAGLAASAAIAVSDIPFDGPISEARVARVNGAWVVNPSTELMAEADIDLMVGASMDSVAMVEGEMSEVSEAEMLEAIKVAHDAIKVQVQAQLDLAAMVPSSSPKREYSHETHDEDLNALVHAKTYDAAFEVAKAASAKHERTEKFEAIFNAFVEEHIAEEERDEKMDLAKTYYGKVKKEAVRNVVLDMGVRLDGRSTTEIRPIWCEIDYLPSPHGSAVFTRGETQSLTTVTLGTKMDVNVVDQVSAKYEERFYLHYNFPPFSTGEARMLRGVSRREIGHGNLAYRALKPMVPADCPYTVRVVSDILESNGSSSMATVCAGTLALMDAGIQIEKPVSGIAMGLITDQETGKFAVLSDILGDEDHLGDMDFKVTGTEDGITACQMDIKIKGLSYEILEQALGQARDGRLHILEKITETIDQPRMAVKEHAPRIVQFDIAKEYIGAVIGPGGKVIQKIQEETGTTIVLTEDDQVGKVEILGTGTEAIEKAEATIRAIAFTPDIGETYEVEVKSLMAFGAIVELAPGKDSLLHVSEIDWKRVENVEDVFKVGDKLEVKLIDIDRSNGRLKVSRKALLPKPEGYVERPPRERRDSRGGDRGGDRRRDDRRGDRRDDRRGDRRRDDR